MGWFLWCLTSWPQKSPRAESKQIPVYSVWGISQNLPGIVSLSL